MKRTQERFRLILMAVPIPWEIFGRRKGISNNPTVRAPAGARKSLWMQTVRVLRCTAKTVSELLLRHIFLLMISGSDDRMTGIRSGRPAEKMQSFLWGRYISSPVLSAPICVKGRKPAIELQNGMMQAPGSCTGDTVFRGVKAQLMTNALHRNSNGRCTKYSIFDLETRK